MHEEDIFFSLICPILVTTADLHVLKSGLTLQEFLNASEIKDVADEVDSLVVHQEINPQFQEYCASVLQSFYKKHSRVKRRLSSLRENVLPHLPASLPINLGFDEGFTNSSKNIVVVRLSALDDLLQRISKAVQNSIRQLEKYAVLIPDIDNKDMKYLPLEE